MGGCSDQLCSAFLLACTCKGILARLAEADCAACSRGKGQHLAYVETRVLTFNPSVHAHKGKSLRCRPFRSSRVMHVGSGTIRKENLRQAAAVLGRVVPLGVPPAGSR